MKPTISAKAERLTTGFRKKVDVDAITEVIIPCSLSLQYQVTQNIIIRYMCRLYSV